MCVYLVYKFLQNPLSWIIGTDVVVVDPPRRGLDASLRQILESVPSIEKRMKSSSQRFVQFFLNKTFEFDSKDLHQNSKARSYESFNFLLFQYKIERKRGEEAVDIKSKGTFSSSWQQADPRGE